MSITLQHLHLVSQDKIKLSEWYCKHLNFTVIEDLETRGEFRGPILISSDEGKTGLSIFNSDKSDNTSLPAFGTDPKTFLDLHKNFSHPRIYDHYRFFSFYIKDLDGNKLEICTLNHSEIKDLLKKNKIDYFLMSPETYMA